MAFGHRATPERPVDLPASRVHSGLVTAPYVPGSGDTHNYPITPSPPKKKISTSNKIALSVLGVIAFCLGGTAIIGSLAGDPAKPATSQTARALAVVPTPTTAVPVDDPAVETPTSAAPAAAPTSAAATRAVSKPSPAKPRPHVTTTKPKPKPTTKPPAAGAVHPGAFCAPEGALGHTTTGTLMRCTRKAGEDRARWRKA